ncbi:uncharacterized protein LOC117916043 [Vitis riparia]|uniref:uncharacterized protein LOC117916043 n=1 Tax=Vitis riparia TaxID=96939 RepID=UPI00155ADE26|nr:uncharacterized protein LOC117916043 [Vitis riparia]
MPCSLQVLVANKGVEVEASLLTLERPSLASNDLPKEDSFEVGTQLERSFNASPSHLSGSRKRCFGDWEGTSPPSGDADRRSILKAPFLSKGKEKLRNFSKGEDRAGFKGFAGFPHRGSSVAVFPSYPVTREKGFNFVGSCGMMVVENLEVSSYQHSQSSLSLLPPPSGLALPHLSPSVPVLPNSAIQSQFPTKP